MNTRRDFFKKLSIMGIGLSSIYDAIDSGINTSQNLGQPLQLKPLAQGKIEDDIYMSRQDCIIEYIGNGANYHITTLHRHLSNLVDLMPTNNTIDITSSTPSWWNSNKWISIDNSYTPGDGLIDHLYGGFLNVGDKTYTEGERYYGISIIGDNKECFNNDYIIVLSKGVIVGSFFLRDNHNSDINKGILLRKFVNAQPDQVILRRNGEDLDLLTNNAEINFRAVMPSCPSQFLI